MTDEQRRDARLVRQILSGDERAFDELYALYKHRLCEFITGKIGDWHYAEELTDDTFLKAKEHLETLQEPEKVLNWMFRIASQLIAGWHRNNQRRIQMESLTNVSEAKVEAATVTSHRIMEDWTLDEERRKKLFKAIAQLPKLEQNIFLLQLAGKSYEEIAEICEVSASSVRNRLSRAKKQLKTWAETWEEANAEGRDLEFSEFHKGKDK